MRPLSLAWLLIGILSLAMAFSLSQCRGETFPDVTETINIAPDVIVWSERFDRRPFILRLLASLTPWGEIGSSHARARIEADNCEISGSWSDDEKFQRDHIFPQRYAIGITGGAEF